MMHAHAFAHPLRTAHEHRKRDRPTQCGTHRARGDMAFGACRWSRLCEMSAYWENGLPIRCKEPDQLHAVRVPSDGPTQRSASDKIGALAIHCAAQADIGW